MLWDYIHHLIDSWDGECVVLGDFNEVRYEQERYGTVFNLHGANTFNNFITMTGLVDLPIIKGYSLHVLINKSASKMSKLYRFLITEGLLSLFPSISALCLDRHLSDHRPIIMRELNTDYGPTPFRFFHSWTYKKGFDELARLLDLDKTIDQGRGTNDTVNDRSKLLKELHDLNSFTSLDLAQKAKIRWAIEGDENSKYFHGIVNKKRSQMAIRGVLVEGDWVVEPAMVKKEFFNHFSNRFAAPVSPNITFQLQFPKCLSLDQIEDLERTATYDEIKKAVWDCGTNKSPGPDGFSFEFFRRYWDIINQDVVDVVHLFFSTGSFPPGCNSSFIALIPKTQEAKMVKDFRPISLIGSMYKIIAKILANRLSLVISDLVSDVQSAFVSNLQILDGPSILNELWDFLDDVLHKFGFGDKWRGWIQGCLSSAMGSILVNGSPTSEFQFYKGLKQGDPLSPFLFILIMENLHFSFENVLNVDKLNFSTIVNVLKWFFLASGLKINIHKSKLMGIGIPQDVVTSTASSIGCATLTFPYYYSDIEDRKMSLIGWKNILASKKNGGLGISSLFALNRALLFKWIWRFITSGPSLWSRFIKAIYGNRGAIDIIHNTSRCSLWLDIIREFKSLSSIDKSCSVAVKVRDLSLISTFRRPPRGGVEEDQLRLLGDIISSIVLSNSNDRWIWRLDSAGDFSVKSARCYIDNFFLPKDEVSTRWIVSVPIKVNIFAWKVCLDKLPTRLNLSIRGLDIPSILCPNCYIAVESTAHILFSCDIACQLMRKVVRW
ncbi:RNA-directed DNA polymerase, eukaryota [Tanacetum coccineum]